MISTKKIISLKNIVCVIALLFASQLFAAEFNATVSNTDVSLGQSLALKLTLREAKAKQAPNLTALTKDFNIYSQQQYSSYSNTNGVSSSEQGWDIILIAKKEGNIVIAPLEIQTNNGILSTKEIIVNVSPAAAGGAKNTQNDVGISLIVNTNKTQAYVKEPIIYTLKIISYKQMSNIALEDIKSNDAIIDKVGEVKESSQVLNGVRAHVIEIKYHVTPLVAGKIQITPAIFYGEMQVPAQVGANLNSHFGIFGPSMFNQMVEIKPFRVQGDKITITGIAPHGNLAEWLPAQNLTLSEDWTNLDSIKVGDNITRKIKIVATGIFANQLPSVKNAQNLPETKLYVDKPQMSDAVNKNNDLVTGTKVESFNIVPLQSGNLVFPAIKISWWNLQTKQFETSTLPEKIINISPDPIKANNSGLLNNTPQASEENNLIIDSATNNKKFNYLYVLIAALLLIILSMTVLMIYLIKRKKPALQIKITPKQSFSFSEINTVVELRDHILNYAIKNWQAPKDISLNFIGAYLANNNFSYDLETYVELCKKINAAVYAATDISLQLLLPKWQAFKVSVQKNKLKASKKTSADYVDLNPT